MRVPQGATIESAHVEFFPRTANNDNSEMLVLAELASDSAAFSGVDNDFTDRAKTPPGQGVEWLVPDTEAWEEDQPVRTPDLATVIQTVVSDENCAPAIR